MSPNHPWRDDDRDESSRPCPSCSQPFIRNGRQTYCTAACRQKAYRQRTITSEIQAATPTPPQRHRRNMSVYQCPDCEQVILGEQWCPDCQRPCYRLGLGGSCPHCAEPVTLDQLLDR
jgi:hypothetical protein